MPRMAAAARRELITAAANGLFAERGYRAVSVDDIAHLAGVSAPVLYDHFDSKRDLYAHLLERQAEQLTASIARATEQAEGGKARLRAAIDGFFALVEEQPLLAGDHAGDEDLRATAARRDAQADAALAEVLGSGGRLFSGEPDRDGELRAQPRVVGHRDLAQPLEQRRPLRGQRDALHPAVRVVAPAPHEALGLERVEVVGDGRAAHAHRLGELGLRAPLLRAHEQQHLPRRGRAAGLGHRALEGLADGVRRPREAEADGREHGRWAGHVRHRSKETLTSKD